MKEKTKQVFYCDYCPKKMFRRNAMIRHEIICGKNPANFYACHDCQHLDVTQSEYENERMGFNGTFLVTGRVKVFTCTKLQKALMTPAAVARGFGGILSEQQGAEKMPATCAEYQQGGYNDH